MQKSVALSLLLLVLAGCGAEKYIPTPEGYRQRLAAYHGRSVNDLVAHMHAPTNVVDLAQGHKLYVWEEKSTAHTQTKVVERIDPQTGRTEYYTEGGERIPLDCTTEAEADAQGIVVRTSAQGPMCLALLPDAGSATAAPGVSSPAVVPAPSAVVPAETMSAPPPIAPSSAVPQADPARTNEDVIRNARPTKPRVRPSSDGPKVRPR